MRFWSLAIAASLCGCDDGRLLASGTSPDGGTGNGSDSSVPPLVDAEPSPDGGATAASIVLTASPGYTQVHLSWSATAGASGYDVYRSDVPGSLGTKVASTSATAADDAAVVTFTPYFYTVVGTYGGATTDSNQAKGFGYDFDHLTIRRSDMTVRAIAFGANRYVAVGERGHVLVSDDGTSWSSAIGPAALTLSGVTYGNGQFVAVGQSSASDTRSIFVSTDGLAWTPRDATTSATLAAVTVASSLYIAVGQAGTIVTSSDGVTWASQTCGTGDFLSIAATQSGSEFMALAVGDNVVCWTSDGATWTQLAPDSHRYTGAVAVEGTHEILALSDSNNLLRTSFDFTSHAFTAAPPTGWIQYANASHGFVGYRDTGGVQHLFALDNFDDLSESTDDGVTWTQPPVTARNIIDTRPNQAFWFTTGLAAASQTVFVLGDGEQIERSIDHGQTFTVVRANPGHDNVGVTTNAGRIVISQRSIWSDGGHALLSTDGVSFTEVDPAVTIPHGSGGIPLPPIATPTGFLLVFPRCPGLKISQSTDGLTWAATPISTFGGATETGTMAMVDGNYVGNIGVYYNGATVPAALYGDSLSDLFAPAATGLGQTPLKQIWGHTGAIYGLGDDQIYTSAPDYYNAIGGTTWTAFAPLPFAGATARLDDGATQYVVNASGQITSSTNGMTWTTPISIDTRGVTAISRIGDHLVAVGPTGLMSVSTDGVTWTAIPLPVQADLSGLTLTDHGFLLVGASNIVISAP